MKIRVEYAYSDGHESTLDYDIPDADVPAFVPATDAEKDRGYEDGQEMWEYLYRYTGDGHGEDSSLGFSYTITILEAADRSIVGLSHELSGN